MTGTSILIESPREGGGFGAGQNLDHSGVRATWPTFPVCMLRYAIRICQTGGVGDMLRGGRRQVGSLLIRVFEGLAFA